MLLNKRRNVLRLSSSEIKTYKDMVILKHHVEHDGTFFAYRIEQFYDSLSQNE